jgi:hypothetical protein
VAGPPGPQARLGNGPTRSAGVRKGSAYGHRDWAPMCPVIVPLSGLILVVDVSAFACEPKTGRACLERCRWPVH